MQTIALRSTVVYLFNDDRCLGLGLGSLAHTQFRYHFFFFINIPHTVFLVTPSFSSKFPQLKLWLHPQGPGGELGETGSTGPQGESVGLSFCSPLVLFLFFSFGAKRFYFPESKNQVQFVIYFKREAARFVLLVIFFFFSRMPRRDTG